MPVKAQPVLSGYAVAGPGGFSVSVRDQTMWFVGGGGEFVASLGVGIGGEFGVFIDDTGWVLGGVSIDGVLQPPRRRGRVFVPLLAAGYSALTGPESGLNAVNIGGGATWWMRERIGLRVEVRDHIDPSRFGGGHYWTVRAGIGFH